jgi:histidine triad (HIT) family protein
VGRKAIAIIMDCVFCKIADGTIPSKKVYEDDKMLAFYDIEPAAPVHIVMIPKEHIASVDALSEENSDVIAHIFSKASEIARTVGLKNGYRITTNCGPDGGQTVFHIHFHLMGGKTLGKMA